MDQAGIPDIGHFLGKYKYVLLVLALGIILMLLPSQKGGSSPEVAAEPAAVAVQSLQEQLSVLLSTMEGAGRVKVLLTQSAGERIHYQTDAESDTRTDTIIVTDANRNQTGLIRQVDPPTYLGAVILCQGAERPSVRLAITEAVANATGLRFDRITILKMK